MEEWKMEKMDNMSNFATQLAEIIDQPIGLDHIHAGTGRFYYIQPTKKGAPMLLHHYRGVFFVDLHPEDLAGLQSGEIDAEEYIKHANWQVGYYWGGGSMIGGGFYQPLDIIGKNYEVRRYLKVLACRGEYLSSGYMPTRTKCARCSVESCSFSPYREGCGVSGIREEDPRRNFFQTLLQRFEEEFQDYTLQGFLCGEIPDDELYLRANWRWRKEDEASFTVCASENIIRSLLMHEIVPESWEDFVKGFQFKIFQEGAYKPATPKAVEEAFKALNATTEEEKKAEILMPPKKVSFLEKAKSFLSGL